MKILIIEDLVKSYNIVANQIKTDFPDCEIFPGIDSTDFINHMENKVHFGDFNFIKSEYVKNENQIKKIFEKIFEFYTDIDFYLIDRSIISSKGKDEKGFVFYDMLIEKNIPEDRIFIITPQPLTILGRNIKREFYYSKTSRRYPNNLISKIKELWKK